MVGPAVGLAAPFVPSHLCVPPEAVVTLRPSVVTGPSNSVCDEPSTRRSTVAGEASAGVHAHSAAMPARASERIGFMMSLPFREGFVAVGRRQVSWLPDSPDRAFPGSAAPQWLRAAGLAGHSGGT